MSSKASSQSLNIAQLHSLIVLCRPCNVFYFTKVFFEDEKKDILKEKPIDNISVVSSHKRSILPFLLHDLEEFESVASLLFCVEQNWDSYTPVETESFCNNCSVANKTTNLLAFEVLRKCGVQNAKILSFNDFSMHIRLCLYMIVAVHWIETVCKSCISRNNSFDVYNTVVDTRSLLSLLRSPNSYWLLASDAGCYTSVDTANHIYARVHQVLSSKVEQGLSCAAIAEALALLVVAKLDL